MQSTGRPATYEEKKKTAFLRDRFLNHSDYYAVQTPGGWRYVPEPLTDDVLLRHVRGEECIGVYPLDDGGWTKFVVFDIDTLDPTPVYALTGVLRLPYVVEHTGGRGRHVWQFFGGEGRLATEVVEYAKRMKAQAGVECEVYPKGVTRQGVPGQALIRLPFGKNQATGEWSRVEWGTFGTSEIPPVQEEIPNGGVDTSTSKAYTTGATWIQAVFAGEVGEGDRNNTLNRLAYWLAARGFPPGVVESVVGEANACLDPPLDEDEVEKILRKRG